MKRNGEKVTSGSGTMGARVCTESSKRSPLFQREKIRLQLYKQEVKGGKLSDASLVSRANTRFSPVALFVREKCPSRRSLLCVIRGMRLWNRHLHPGVIRKIHVAKIIALQSVLKESSYLRMQR
ncbi:uncharacterized protein ZBAI_05543 [Zygosaccharomyces bailii ISA1307]|nr:uncharacterized protein ZBAI_05543 [Zygosaccharomyces bailii ISA1307]